jgi:MFS family permease
VSWHKRHGCFTTILEHGVISITPQKFNRSVNSISYQVGIHVLGLAFGNLLWTPLGNTYGRRPVYIVSMLVSLVGNIGGSRAPTYGTLMVCRFIQGFGTDAANATGASTIADLFFLHERGAKTGLWTYPTTVG